MPGLFCCLHRFFLRLSFTQDALLPNLGCPFVFFPLQPWRTIFACFDCRPAVTFLLTPRQPAPPFAPPLVRSPAKKSISGPTPYSLVGSREGFEPVRSPSGVPPGPLLFPSVRFCYLGPGGFAPQTIPRAVLGAEPQNSAFPRNAP